MSNTHSSAFDSSKLGGSMLDTTIKEYIKTLKVEWVFLPVDVPSNFKDPSSFYSVMGIKQRNALFAAGIHCVELSREEAYRKVSISSIINTY